MAPDLRPLGDRAFLARFATEEEARRWALAARARDLPGVDDVVLAYRAAAVFADPDRCDLSSLERELLSLEPSPDRGGSGARHIVPVVYDGPDLTDVAGALGLSIDAVVDLHSGRDYTVFAVGFLPGFPYAGHLHPSLCGLPRLSEPRLAVAPGSVAIVGRQTAIYPTQSPGGWRLLGRTPLQIADFDAGRFPIQAGDSIRFRPIGRSEYEARRGERL